MLEPLRSRYLQALGVEIYRANYPLPGAAPSVLPEWGDTDAEPIDPSITNDDAAPHPVARQSRPVLDGLPSAAARRNGPQLVETVSSPSVAAPLRIKFTVAVSDGGVLIIDDALSTARGEMQRLLSNLLFALQEQTVTLKAEAFEWPLPNLRNRQIELNEQAARETLAAFLHRKLVGDVRTIFLLGNSAQRWVDAPLRASLSADRQLHWGLSLSAAAVLSDPGLKRQWWQDLRAIVAQ